MKDMVMKQKVECQKRKIERKKGEEKWKGFIQAKGIGDGFCGWPLEDTCRVGCKGGFWVVDSNLGHKVCLHARGHTNVKIDI